MNSISNYFYNNPKTTQVVVTCPVVGTIVPIATAIYLNNSHPDRLPNAQRKMIGQLAGAQLLSCGIAGTAAYLLSHYAVFAAVFKISAIFGGIVLGTTSFFIVPAVILGLFLLYKAVLSVRVWFIEQ